MTQEGILWPQWWIQITLFFQSNSPEKSMFTKWKNRNVRKLNPNTEAVESLSSSEYKNWQKEKDWCNKWQGAQQIRKMKVFVGGKYSKCSLKWPVYFLCRGSLKYIDFFFLKRFLMSHWFRLLQNGFVYTFRQYRFKDRFKGTSFHCWFHHINDFL